MTDDGFVAAVESHLGMAYDRTYILAMRDALGPLPTDPVKWDGRVRWVAAMVRTREMRSW